MIEIGVDFNSVTSEGFVRSRQSRANGILLIGDVVKACSDEGFSVPMVVVETDGDRVSLDYVREAQST